MRGVRDARPVECPQMRKSRALGPGSFVTSATLLSGELRDLRGAGALLASHDLELDASALLERAVAVTLDVGVVHEEVLAVLGRDETEALRVVEPLHDAVSH